MAIAIILLLVIVIYLHRISNKIEKIYDSFESYYGDWQKKFDPYVPDYDNNDTDL
jgi:hypothetical protein